MLRTQRIPVVVLGAGPAGLGVASQLSRRGGFEVTIIERRDEVGGNAGSFDVAGLRVDYGSHRLHPSCRPEILGDIRAMLGDALLDRPRHGRILLRDRWVRFPLKPADLVLHLPPGFAFGVLRDAAGKLLRKRGGETFAAVLESGVGRTICRDFYFPYAEKIWGTPPELLDAEQARRRVSTNSLGGLVKKLLRSMPGFRPRRDGRFFYPKCGFGAISEAYCRAAVEAGARVLFRTEVRAVEIESGCVAGIVVEGRSGTMRLPASQVFSTIPIPVLARAAVPAAPAGVIESAASLEYRAMILIYLALDADRFTEYDAHYFPSREISITRLSEPKNYSLRELHGTTVLCAELPCSREDRVWTAEDRELGALVLEDLARAGIPVRAPVRAIVTRRLGQAYPIYLRGFREHFERLDNWASGVEGLVTLGRQGLFAHDNTHHALAMAYAAADCLDNSGRFDHQKWAAHRESFREHVVED